MFEGFAIGFAIVSFMVSFAASCVASWAIIEVLAFKRSTHQVQFVPAGDELAESRDDNKINRELTDSEYEAMMNAFGDKRVVKDDEEMK